MKTKGLLTWLCLLPLFPLGAQSFFVNNGDGDLMSLDINGCTSTFEQSVGSFTDITYHPDGNFYLIKSNGQLYRLNTASGTSTYLTAFPGQGLFVALTADADGMIYGASLEGSLHAYQPATNTHTSLPNMGIGASGDLTFYQGGLYMASTDNTLVRIYPDNPAANSVFLDFSSANATIYGIVSHVDGCQTRTYASSNDSSSRIYEIDWQNQTFNYVCSVPYRINGGAGTEEFEASQSFITVDEPQITQAGCDATVATLEVSASSPNGTVTYSLGNGTPQSGGLFPDLPFGEYVLTITDPSGCVHYEHISVEANDGISIGNINASPATCGEDNGSISIIADSPAGGLQYSINGGVDFSPSGNFQNLPPGPYDILITDAMGCSTSQQVAVGNEEAFELLDIITTDPSCGEDNGNLTAEVADNGNAVFYSLDGNTYSTLNTFDQLPGGDYTLYIKDGNDCTLQIPFTMQGTEALELESLSITPASCANNDGNISIRVTGGEGSILYTLGERQNISGDFTSLPSGSHTIYISSADGCELPPVTTLMVDSCDIYIPNAFSPNKDGFNDLFHLFSPTVVEIHEARILNRWGGTVFQRKNFFSDEFRWGWDGIYQGVEAESGVYTYFFHLTKNGKTIIISGELTLLR